MARRLLFLMLGPPLNHTPPVFTPPPLQEEIGPFTYTKHAIKQGITFLNGTVSFHDYTYYLPCPELTPLSPDTPITTLNLPLVGALEKIDGYAPASAARWLSWLARAVEAWSGADVEGLFTTRSARELLWGYDDPLLKRLHWFAPGLDPHFTIVHNISGAAAAATRPANVMATGARDPGEVWQAREWRGLTRVTAWAPPHVEHVRGGDGLQFQPGVTLGQGHVVWVGEAFRAATLLAQEEVGWGGVEDHGGRGGRCLGRWFRSMVWLMRGGEAVHVAWYRGSMPSSTCSSPACTDNRPMKTESFHSFQHARSPPPMHSTRTADESARGPPDPAAHRPPPGRHQPDLLPVHPGPDEHHRAHGIRQAAGCWRGGRACLLGSFDCVGRNDALFGMLQHRPQPWFPTLLFPHNPHRAAGTGRKDGAAPLPLHATLLRCRPGAAGGGGGPQVRPCAPQAAPRRRWVAWPGGQELPLALGRCAICLWFLSTDCPRLLFTPSSP